MEKIKNYFVRTTHFYNSLEEICYDILACAIRRFCTLTKEGCVTDTEKEVIKQLRDKNYKYATNKPGLWERIRKKWNVYIPQKFQLILGCALTVLLEDPEYWRGFYIERNIFWKSRFHKYIFNGLLSPTIHF